MLNVGPRIDVAYDLTGREQFVFRGSTGLYFDRARPGNAQALVGNTFISSLVTVRNSTLQALQSAGLTTQGPPALVAFEYDAKLPTSAEWNAGVQMALPYSVALDVSYVGRHNYNAEQTVDINKIDYGTAFLASTQDPTVPVSTTPGASSFAATNPDLLRAFRGYGTLNYRSYDAWRTFHSLQFNISRRFRNGLQFGFNDAITLSDVAAVLPRYNHDGSGQVVLRDDQAQAQELLGRQDGLAC